MKRKIVIHFMPMMIVLPLLLSCSTNQAVKPNEVDYGKRNGKLITQDDYVFSYKHFPAATKGPSVIFIPGMGGRPTWGGKGAYALADHLNELNINFIGFDRAGALSKGNLPQHIKNARKRSASGSVDCPSFDGKESTAQNIVRNEISALIVFIEASPTHDAQKGIYLIGGSFGAMIALESVESFPEKIKGVVFVSPAILPDWYTKEFQSKYPQIDILNHFQSLIKTFGSRQALAIGSSKDQISPQYSGTALDSAKFLREKIGANVEVFKVESSYHSWELIGKDENTRNHIAQWLKENPNF